ncbi:MAG: YfiT family bacillithiol transferase [Gilvibacter sp.]
MSDNYHLRFPIGEYTPPITITKNQRELWIDEIESFPKAIKNITQNLNEAQTLATYRPGGWNIRQLVHHCADSHSQAYTRFKLTLSETNPIIKPYDEADWATHPDANDATLAPSLHLLEGLHYRWCTFMRSLSNTEWERSFVHPEHNTSFSLLETVGNYAWHGKHHLAHIQLALDSNEEKNNL